MRCRRHSALGRLQALVVALALSLLLPAAAEASRNQFSILQDDAVFLGLTPHDPDDAMEETKALGVDMVRSFISWRRVSPKPDQRTLPDGFDVSDPNSPGYDWKIYDDLVERARRHGLRVFLTLAPAIPNWASDEPRRCPHLVGGYRNLGRSCMWKPNKSVFGEFAEAVARRYRGKVSLYSIWNEPNLEHYLYPQLQRTRYGMVDVAARRYRELWWEGWKGIAAIDRPMRNRVLFGETAAISSPMDTLYAALCLDQRGQPFRGRLRVLQGCVRPRKLPIAGIAHHPYNNHATGTVFSRSFTLDSLPVAYVSRLGRLMSRAAQLGRIPRGKGIYLTEFGFQTNPPDRTEGLGLGRHATAINEAERLWFSDPRVRSVAQFELYDVPRREEYNTGLRRFSGAAKPALRAFRMPIVVTNRGPAGIEIWGAVRPAVGRTVANVAVLSGGRVVRTLRVGTNPRGYFMIHVRSRDAARLRYQARWTTSKGEELHSRVAGAGPLIRYLD